MIIGRSLGCTQFKPRSSEVSSIFSRESRKKNSPAAHHSRKTRFVAFAPYENPKIALAVLVQGAKAGGQVPAPIAAKIVEEILALDKGYDPGVKALEPAVGNFGLGTISAVSSSTGAVEARTQDLSILHFRLLYSLLLQLLPNSYQI